jgi:hypothetical protein
MPLWNLDCPNALVESTNTKIRVLTRVAFGFADPQALIALAMLSLGGGRPALPSPMMVKPPAEPSGEPSFRP